jgi:hypothetical protein
MTVGAATAQRSVQYGKLILDDGHLVASSAGDLLVRAVQCKLGIFVVREQQVFPTGSLVTFFAGNRCLAALQELASVIIFVTARTIPSQRLHPDLFSPAIKFSVMAFQAEDFPVLSVEDKSSLGMIEGGLVPSLSFMTEGTAAFLYPKVNLTLMDVFMAIGAVGVFQVEVGDESAVFVLNLDVASVARYRQVTAG